MALRFRPETLTLGLLLVATGVLLLLSNLGRLDFLATVRTFWPACFLVWGVVELAAAALARVRQGRS
jgi:hypothetical protein